MTFQGRFGLVSLEVRMKSLKNSRVGKYPNSSMVEFCESMSQIRMSKIEAIEFAQFLCKAVEGVAYLRKSFIKSRF